MDIHSEIKNILKIHSAVILKGIGGFISKYQPAKIENSKSFNPPSKQVDFKPELQYADDTLKEYLFDKYNFKTPEEIDDEINIFLESVINELNNNKRVNFPGIGSLRKENNLIIFDRKMEENLLDDAYGLDSFELLPVENEDQQPNNTNTSAMKKKKSDAIYWVAIFGVIIITLAAVGYIIYHNPQNFNISFFKKKNKTNTHDIVLGQNAYIDSLQIASKLDESSLKENALSYEEKMDEKISEPTKSTPISVSAYSFYIVAGSFANPANAEKLKIKLSAKQLPADVIQVNETLYRVVIGKYNDKQLALKDYYRYKKQYKELNVWFLGS